jgi:heme/copper-type cytochrome/quinol oxidase subunit 2
MKAILEVVDAKEYDDWAKEQAASALKKTTEAAAPKTAAN